MASDQDIVRQIQQGVRHWKPDGNCNFHAASPNCVYDNQSRLITLHLCQLGLQQIPLEVWQCSSLQELNLTNNRLRFLPADIGQLTSLQTLSLSRNWLSFLPAEVSQLIFLRELWLDDNQFSSLPMEVTQLTYLRSLYLRGNQLSSLPMELSRLFSLQVLALHNNPLQSPPPNIIAQGLPAILSYLRAQLHAGTSATQAQPQTLSAVAAAEKNSATELSPHSIKLFYCYARRDKRLRGELEKHLEALRRSGQITTWYDREIQPGMEWQQEIDKHLSTSEVILLLISPDFMKSDYCYGREMQQALKRHRAGEARVIPILLRPVDWNGTPIQGLQALPSNAKPIATWRSRDEAFQDVAEGIRQVVAVLRSEKVKQKGGSAHSEIVTLEIPLRPEDLEPDFSNFTNTRWYRHNPEKLHIHIDTHDFCTKVIEIAAKAASDIESDETLSLPLRKNLLGQIKRTSETYSIWLPLYWDNLSDLLTRLQKEIFASFRHEKQTVYVNDLATAELALHSMQFTLEHAHYRLASALCSAIFPHLAEKFGFPDIATYMRKYQAYTSDLSFGSERAIAKIYLAKEYENRADCLIDAAVVGLKDRHVDDQRFYLPDSLGVDMGDLQIHPRVDAVIDRASWYLYCLPQILIRILWLATSRLGGTIAEMEEQNYKLGLNMGDYKLICNP